MQTIEAILAAFVAADKGTVDRLPLSPLLYPQECVEATFAQFEGICSGALVSEGDVSLVSLAVRTSHEPDAVKVVGEFFNHALALSIKAGSHRP
jgi:hypothetical protein